MIDFNDAEPQVEFGLIPANTIAKAMLTVKQSNDPQNPGVTKSKILDSSYVNCEFTIVEGEYAKRKVFHKIGVVGNEMWVKRGKSLTRAILESAKNIDPKDMSEKAKQARNISSFLDLDGLEPIIKIGIERDRNGAYPDRNKILGVITPDSIAYQTYIASFDMPW
jgi:hypothetical protein